MQNYKHPILGDDVLEAIGGILKTGILSGFRGTGEGHYGGEVVRQLEAEFKNYFGCKYALTLNSATAGLHAALIACGIGQGDEVIVSPYSFSSSVSCVLMVGAKPIFADIQDDIFCIDPVDIKRKITPRTKVIIPVHLCGHPADMDGIMTIAREYNLKVIEDAAQSIGAIYKRNFAGTIGDCGIFSFNQSKQISSGEGGMLITDDDEIARIVMAVRNHGEISDPELKIVGYNYRMCEIEAAMVLIQFRELERNIAHRIKLASYLSERLIGGLTPPVTYPDCRHTFYTYATKFDKAKIGMTRDDFQKRMIDGGIYFGGGYVKPLYLLPVYGYEMGLCPVTERMWRGELMVTDIIKPPATLDDMDEIVNTIKGILNG